MFRSPFRSIVLALIAGSIAIGVAAPSHAATAVKPMVKLSTKTLVWNQKTKLFGSHLQARSVYTAVFAQPDAKHIKGLFGAARTDGKGNFTMLVKTPPLAVCGKATIVLYPRKSKATIQVPVTVTGCKPSKVKKLPPPPPSP